MCMLHEFGDFAVEFVAFAIELFVPFAIEFVGFATEFIPFAIDFVAFAVKFVRNKNGSWSKHEHDIAAATRICSSTTVVNNSL